MMSVDKIIRDAVDAFKQKMTAFCEKFDFSHLDADLAEEMGNHLKDATAAAGREGYRSYIESFDTDKPVIGHQGSILRNKGKVPKTFLCSFGEMTIERSLYQNDRGGPSYVPLDAAWGMRGEYATVDVRETVTFAAAHCTPQETHELLGKCSLFHPSTTAIKHIIDGVGSVFEVHGNEMKHHIHTTEQIPAEATAVAVSADGANVLLRDKGSRNRRPAERPTLRSGREEQTCSAYRNAMVGSISFYGEKGDEEEPQRLAGRYMARMPQDGAVDFKYELEQEVSKVLSDAEVGRLTKLLLMDGSRSLWKYVQGNPLYEDFECVIDFYHSADHLSKAAEALFGKSTPAATAWFNKWRTKLRSDSNAPNGILRSIEYYAGNYKLSRTRRKDLAAEITFFRRNKSRMNYAALRARGLPIGSGPIEAACKSIVKCRLCRSGMRWSRRGGQKILTFRTLVKSQRWEAAWEYYKELAKAA